MHIVGDLKIPDNLVRLILLDEFLFVYIPFSGIVKLNFVAQFPMDLLPHSVLLSILLLNDIRGFVFE